MFKGIAVCCSVLQCVAVYRSVYAAMCSGGLQYVAVCCSMLQCGTVYSIVLQCVVVYSSVLQ